ncbi:aromatic amino acid lyase [Trinickia terrae]|uniref:Aromatic amino acid lyase n=1 Tax=Trinickia terrae TaxID=2571161 RepID=A0A4U1IFJ9_9BURK|nr:aromatic amino acid ammonia-lyase [Trinickia terrae]TKC92509.1 aromatic amino acid lyase [Trinickia terrae]
MLRSIPRLIVACALLHATLSFAEVQLDGRSATPAVIARIAGGEQVGIAPAARTRVENAQRVLLAAAQAGQQIYGLTVGVGLNKDHVMVDAHGKLTDEVLDASRRFNIGLIHAHSGGVGADMDIRVARAAMAARLNAMLDGGAGVQPAIVDTYVQFLNHGITPAMPSDGSIGEADITILSHVGLAMLGEGDVYYQGKKMPAADALDSAGIAPIKPYGKDALAILSSNAYAAGMAALALDDMARLARTTKLVYALSLQALNGNVSPFLHDTLALRPFPYTMRAGDELRALLAGGSIWNRDDQRPLQDPLSFRSGVYLLGEEDRVYDETRALLDVQLNSSDDNPGVAVGVTPKSARWQDKRGYVDANPGGAVLPSANFEPLPWVLAFEELGLVLAHNSLASAQRIVKLNDSHLTGLPRYLGTGKTVHAFGAMEKPVMALAMENKQLAMPVSTDYLPVAGGIEDIATNAPQVVERVQRQIDNSYALLGIELIHAAQAVDLRKQQQADFTLSPAAQELYSALRRQVAFLDQDRPLTIDFRAAADLLRNYHE